MQKPRNRAYAKQHKITSTPQVRAVNFISLKFNRLGIDMPIIRVYNKITKYVNGKNN